MEIFIRGLIALGIALAVATLGFSDTVAPGAVIRAEGGGCGCSGTGVGSGKKLFGGGLHLFAGSNGNHGKGAGQADPGRHGPRTQPGTVVFPQHPFVRSPRDFFMAD